MKRFIMFSVLMLVVVTVFDAHAQLVQWQSLDGPWYASYAVDISIGYRGNQKIIYVADSSANSLLKSTDEGATWTHLSVANPLAVACIPHKPETLYVGRLDAGGVGMWKSTNGGESFFPINQGFDNAAPKKIGISPHDENLIYVGCNRYGFPPDIPPTLFRTTNAGVNWEAVRPFPEQPTVTSIVFDPQNRARIWISGYVNDPRSTGVWFTADEGLHWEQRNNGLDNGQIGAMVGDPNYPNTLYAGTLIGDSRIYKSVNGGEEWVAVYSGGLSSIYGMAIDPRSRDYKAIYAASSQGVLKSTDEGQTWNLIVNGMYDRIALSVAIDRQTPDVIYAGTFASIYRSVDGGQHWVEKTRGIERSMTTDLSISGQSIFAVSANPALPASIINASFDGGLKWLMLYSNGNHEADYEGSALAHSNNIVLAGGRKGCRGNAISRQIIRSTDSGLTWGTVLNELGCGYIREFEFDPSNLNIVFAVGDRLGHPNTYAVYKSTNKGASWIGLYNADHAWSVEFDSSGVSPSNVYVAGIFGIIKSTNGGTNWTSVGFGQTVFSLALNPTAPTVIYAGTASRIYKTTNGGATWSLLTNSPATKIGWLLLHPVTTSVVYAVAPDQQKVYRSTDDGATWSEYIGGLPQAAVHRVRLDIDNPNVVYAATDDGIYSIPHIWTGEITGTLSLALVKVGY